MPDLVYCLCAPEVIQSAVPASGRAASGRAAAATVAAAAVAVASRWAVSKAVCLAGLLLIFYSKKTTVRTTSKGD